MPDEAEKTLVYTEEDVKKVVEGVQAAAINATKGTAFNAAALALEGFAETLLEAAIETNSDAARQGAEAMRRKVVSVALQVAKGFRAQAAGAE